MTNTPQGLRRLINILRAKELIKLQPYQEARRITEKAGKTPRNISDLAYDRTAQSRKKYAQIAKNIAEGKPAKLRTNNETGEREILFNNKWLSF